MIKARPLATGFIREVRYGSRGFQYELLPSQNDTLLITVFPDLHIQVKAPAIRHPIEVDQRVKRRGSWIIKQLEYFRQFMPLPAERRYLSGETHFYLGRQYRLKVESIQGVGLVAMKGRYIYVGVPDRNNVMAIKDLLEIWYRKHAKELFKKRLELCMNRVAKYGIMMPSLRIRRMKSRWGSHNSNNRIALNLDLIKTPIQCIDYVIVHELCHSKEHNHGPEFENLLTKCMPDWRIRKDRLELSIIT
jgi:predicted metal-dependent hydrolase